MEDDGPALRALLAFARRELDGDPRLRELVRLLGRALAELATEERAGGEHEDAHATPEGAPVAAAAQEARHTEVQAPPRSDPETAPAEPRPVQGPRAVVPLRIGDAAPIEVEVQGPADAVLNAMRAAQPPPRPVPMSASRGELPDLDALARRCEIKARAAQHAIDRASGDGGAWHQAAADLLKRYAAAGGESLWPLELREESVARVDALRQAFANVGAAAQVVSLARTPVEGEPLADAGDPAFGIAQLFAEAQSALRVAAQECDEWRDAEQDTAFRWLRAVTESERIFLPRFMRLDDPADPALGADLSARIAAAKLRLEQIRSGRTAGTRLRRKLQYHIKQLTERGSSEHDWSKVAACVAELREAGATASSLRAMLAPLHGLASDAPAALAEWWESPASLEEPPAAQRSHSPAVLRAREALRGKRMVVLGGERRQETVDRYLEAFELAEVEWVSLTEHASSAPLRAPIFKPGTAVLLLLIKLAGHLHIDDARRWAREAGVPWINLPAGYSPEQVAVAVAEQAGEHFGLPADASPG